jgi:chromosome partitioning protein
LLADLDPQGHCALGMAVPDEQIDLSVFDCLEKQIEGEPIEFTHITWQITPNLDLAPSRASLARLEPKVGVGEGADTHLRDLLQAHSGRYDYCVIDCPPHLGLLMRNALNAADEVIIPVDTGYFSLHGLGQQLTTIEQVCEKNGRKPVVRILPNQYDVRTKLAREILAELRSRYKGLVYDTIVNFNTKLKEGASYGQPITEFAPTSMGARDFQALAREIMTGTPVAAPTADMLRHVEKLAADAERLLATTTTLVETSAPAAAVPTAKTPIPVTPPTNVPEAVPATYDRLRRGTPGKMPNTAPSGVHESKGASTSRGAGSSIPEVTVARREAGASRPAQLPASPASAGPRGATARAEPETPIPSTQNASKAPEALPEVASSEEIDRKIEAIYGVRQDGEVVIFRSPNPEASEVQLAGDFNDWMPHTTPMHRLSDGDFEARLRLPKGRYRYRLVVDGRWSHDLHNPVTETNEYGELNSIAEIKR